ncbi:MAG: hypothetical protein ACTSRC_11915 [Candidatus Helarchaeota archaeon]
MAKEAELKSKYIELGKEPISFYSVTNALLRDNILTEREIDGEKQYNIPASNRADIQSLLNELETTIKELEGKLDELPPSALMLLKLVCNKAEKRTVKNIRQEFKGYYVSSQTWRRAKQLLNERNLIQEENDEVIEDKVMYSPKMICPILGGLMYKYQSKLKEAVVEKTCDVSLIETKLKEASDGMISLLHLLLNSGGSLNKRLLKGHFTNPPGYSYSESSYTRYLRDLKKFGLLNEEIEEENSSKIKIISIPDDFINCLVDHIENRLLMTDTEITQNLEFFTPSALNLAKICCDMGGNATYQEVRRNFLEYYSRTTWSKAFNLLENLIFFEGVNEEGETLIVIPEKYIGQIEDYLETNEIKLPEKKIEKITAEDFIVNTVNTQNLIRFAIANEVEIDKKLDNIVNDILYDKKIPLNVLLEKTIPKIQLSEFLKVRNKPSTGTKKKLAERIIPLLEVSEDIQKSGTFSKETEKKLEEIKEIEKVKEIEEDTIVKGKLDRDLVIEGIIECRTKSELRDFCKNLKLPISGNMRTLTERLLFATEVNSQDLLNQLLTERGVTFIVQSANLEHTSKEEVIKNILAEVKGFKQKDKTLKFENILINLSKNNLMELCSEFNQARSGNKQQLISNIMETGISINTMVKTLVKKVPTVFDVIFKRLDIKFDDDPMLARNQLIKRLGGTIEEEKGKLKLEEITKDKIGLLKFLGLWMNENERFKEEIEVLSKIHQTDFNNDELVKSLEAILEKIGESKVINETTSFKDLIDMFAFLKIPIPEKKNKSNLETTFLLHFGIESVDSSEETKRILMKNLPTITVPNWANIYVKLAYGGLDSLKEVGEQGKEILTIISQKNKNRIQGIIFEWATAKIFEYLRKQSKMLLDFQPRIKLEDINKWSEYEEDGLLQIKGTGGGHHTVLYDCKAYSDGYNITHHIEKIDAYIRQKKSDFEVIDEGNLSGFLIISSKFQGTPSYHVEKKLNENLRGKTKIILLQATLLKKLFDETNKYSNENQVWIHQKYNWLQLFQLDTNLSTIIIKPDQISEIVKKAKAISR